MVRVVVTCAPGTEDLAAAELDDAGAPVVPPPAEVRGRVFANVGSLRDAARLLLKLRIANRLGVVVGAGQLDAANPLLDARRFARDLDLDAWMQPGRTFAVRARRQGEHAFRRLELERAIGGTTHTRYTEALGEAPRVDLNDSDLLVRADVDAAHRIVAWVDLVGGDSLHRRGWRTIEHPASLKATLACALFRLAGWSGDGLLADPMTGGGTLGIEAAWLAADVPPVAMRRESLLLRRAGPLREVPLDELLPVPPLPDDLPLQEPGIVCADRSAGHLIGARRNAERARVRSRLRVVHAEAAELPKYAAGARLLAANPPYGIRLGSKEELAVAYHDVLVRGAEALAEGGAVGIVTPRTDLVRAYAERAGLRLVENRAVMHGDIVVHLLVLRR